MFEVGKVYKDGKGDQYIIKEIGQFYLDYPIVAMNVGNEFETAYFSRSGNYLIGVEDKYKDLIPFPVEPVEQVEEAVEQAEEPVEQAEEPVEQAEETKTVLSEGEAVDKIIEVLHGRTSRSTAAILNFLGVFYSKALSYEEEVY